MKANDRDSDERHVRPQAAATNSDPFATKRTIDWSASTLEPRGEPTAPPPDPCFQIGRYRVERVLGEGGFGRVYLAEDEQLRRQVAIKVPHARHVATAEDAAPYLAEARTLASLDHRHIVPVYDVGSTPTHPCFLVCKFIEGENLCRLIRRRVPQTQAAELMATVAEALHYAHKRGVVHRDVKPANILLDREGTAYVTDFGLALCEKDLGKGSRYAGTPAYMSPEQARGEGNHVDGRSDIFGLGVVMYELLVGRRPFLADDSKELLQLIIQQLPKPPRQVDDSVHPELERICLKALAKDPLQRYTTAKDFAADLRGFLNQSAGVVAASPGTKKQRLWPIVGSSLVLLLLLIWIVVKWFPSTEVKSPDTRSLISPSGTGPVSGLDALPLASALQVQIHLQRAGERTGFRVLAAPDLPLRDGDKIHIHASSPAPAYLYLWWVDSNGQFKRLWPTGDIQQQAELAQVWSPPLAEADAPQEWHLIGGQPGVEMLFVAAAQARLSAENIQRLEQTQIDIRGLHVPGRIYTVRPHSADTQLGHVQRAVVGQVASQKGAPQALDELLDLGLGTYAAVVLFHDN